MVPWAIWTVMVAAINLTAFVAVRGRWGRVTVPLGLAALGGTALGNAVAEVIGFDLLVLGEFHLLGATIGAQLAMVVTLALATLLAPPPTDRSARHRDAGRSGR